MHHRYRIFCSSLILSSGVAAQAQVINEDAFYFPEPTLQGGYGSAVDLDAGVMIVGAPGDSDLGVSAGAAYLVDIQLGTTIAKLTPAGVGTGDFFGTSVAISGAYAAVSAPNDSDLGFDTGAVYIFESATGALVRRIDGPGLNANFGNDIDLDGSMLLVGAPEFDSGGEAYLFDAITGLLLQSFDKRSSFGFDQFGDGVALDADAGIVAISAPGEFIPASNERVGAVHLFSASNGNFLRTMVSPASENTDFGVSLDTRDALVLVGAPKYPDFVSDEGAAYLFDASNGSLLHTLRIDDAPSPTQFNSLGHSVQLGDGVALLGAPGWDFAATGEGFNNGAGFIFSTGSGEELATLIASVATLGDRIGDGVAIDGTAIALGAPGDDYTGGFDAGSVGVYTYAPPCPADLNNDGVLNFFDVSAYLIAFNAMDLIADFNNDGLFNFFDVSAFLSAYNAGCP
tara:strand:+ start:12249 stop:13616 length:1368 start_codon:yes stop_codon:yes gene_type:complete